MSSSPSVVALIPARAGSKRVPGKNIRDLNGHPLLAYAIRAAVESKIFDYVFCATDSPEYAAIAQKYGATVPELRPARISGDVSPDIEWVQWALSMLKEKVGEFDAFSILRPTSPFRTEDTIKRAWQQFMAEKAVDSLRAVELCKQHPGKMWVVNSCRMAPLLPFSMNGQPWHSNQTAALPQIYVQNACLELAWTKVVYETGTIAGFTVMPFMTKDLEGIDINNEEDWLHVEYLLSKNLARLPDLREYNRNS